MKSYAGKTALVTGASSGIGKAIAADLAGRGSNLVLTARSKDRLEEIAWALRAAHGVKIEVVALDLSLEGAAARLFQEVADRGLSVDLLVNNAGFGKWGNFLSDDLPTLAEMMTLNMRALVELCHLFLPSMAARGDCAILNIGSTGSFVPVPWSAVYGATKAFVLSFSEALNYEYKDNGVHVGVLCPGNTESNFAAVANAQAKKTEGESASAESVAKFGLDELLKGKCVMIPGGFANQQVTILPRVLPRARVVQIAGDTWKRRLLARGVTI
jgi:short-subunit dehydrogenase